MKSIVSYLKTLQESRRMTGRSYLSKSPIYWNRTIFEFVMTMLYGQEPCTTYAAVAQRIPNGVTVVDLCCGTARLYSDHLRSRGCTYVGLDFNGHFVADMKNRGITARFFNAITDPVPPGDCITMVSSFYHFRRHASDVLNRMRSAARMCVIISEPVRNISGKGTFLSRLAGWLSNPGVGEYEHRFSLEDFKSLAQTLGASEFSYKEGEHNAIAVFPPLRDARPAT